MRDELTTNAGRADADIPLSFPRTPPPIAARHRYSVEDGKGDIIAHVEIEDRSGVRWLTNLWVHPDHRRQGIARALMARAVREYQRHTLFLCVRPYTDQAIGPAHLAGWYGAFGFLPTTVPGVLRRLAAPVPGDEEAAL